MSGERRGYAASVVVGVLPALHVRRLNFVPSLADDGTSPVGLTGRTAVARSRLLIIGGQVAIACVCSSARHFSGAPSWRCFTRTVATIPRSC